MVIAAGSEIVLGTAGQTLGVTAPYFGNKHLAPELIYQSMMEALNANITIIYEHNRDYGFFFGEQWPKQKVGDTIAIRKPARYAV